MGFESKQFCRKNDYHLCMYFLSQKLYTEHETCLKGNCTMIYSKEIVRKWLDEVAEQTKDHPEWVDVFERCYTDTLDNTVEILEDGSTFVLTGIFLLCGFGIRRPNSDPTFMWLKDPLLRQTIAGLVKRQMTLVLKDPYANSFNIEENWKGHHETDHTDLNGWIWERKYEVDSLCYPLQLAYLLWKETGETSQFDETFVAATKGNSSSLDSGTRPQELSLSFCPWYGPQERYSGKWWLWTCLCSDRYDLVSLSSSDDCCQYSYLIPSNMFAVVVLGYVQEIFAELDLADNQNIVADAKRLQAEIKKASKITLTQLTARVKKIYAFEVDGLEMPASWTIQMYQVCWRRLIWYCDIEDEVYQATRRTILSPENPYFYQGKYASGLEVLIPSIAISGPLPFLSKAWQQEIRQRRNSCWTSWLPAMVEQVSCTKAST